MRVRYPPQEVVINTAGLRATWCAPASSILVSGPAGRGARRTPPHRPAVHESLADFLNYYNHERPHAALGGRPPIGRTAGSDYRVVFDEPPEPVEAGPQQLTFDDAVEPTS
ncbi:integrase core domain-containing protein [Streptomyces prunicolor]|uniref:integrase core domain-containing protein n=1 Tax=Streptomyces prunicolor TaxID=67348 RepID=UPI0037150FFF